MDDALTTADGLTLQLRTWPVERPHGSVLVVHGLGEHIGRYAVLATRLNVAGWVGNHFAPCQKGPENLTCSPTTECSPTSQPSAARPAQSRRS